MANESPPTEDGGPSAEPNAADLLASLQATISAYADDGRTEELLSDATVADAQKLLRLVTEASADGMLPLAVVSTVAWVRWCRFLALPEGDDGTDLGVSVRLFALLMADHAARVPNALREVLAPPEPTQTPTSRPTTTYQLLGRALRDHDRELLDAVVDLIGLVLRVTPQYHPDRPRLLAQLGTAWSARFSHTGQVQDAQRSVAVLRAALAAFGPDGHERLECLLDLSGTAYMLFTRTDDPALLDEAVVAGHAAVNLSDHDSDAGRLARSHLCMAYRARYERAGAWADLDAAVQWGRAALDGVSNDGKASWRANLGIALRSRYERTGELAEIDEAIALHRQAMTATATSDPQAATIASNLGNALLARFKRVGDRDALREAVVRNREAVALLPLAYGERGRFLANLGTALHAMADEFGALSDLDDAIAAHNEAVRITPADHPLYGRYVVELCSALEDRLVRTDSLDDGLAAESMLRQVVDATPVDHPEALGRYSNLSHLSRQLFERTGDRNRLDRSVSLARMAVNAIAKDHPSRAMFLSNLGFVLLRRADWTGEMDDVKDAIEACRAAVEAAPVDLPKRTLYMYNLGYALLRRFQLNADRAYAAEAIASLRAAAAPLPAGHLDRPARLSGLGVALFARYQRFAEFDDLDEAIARFREAVGYSSLDNPARSTYLSNAAVALRVRYLRSGRAEDLNEAVQLGSEAVQGTPDRHPFGAIHRLSLGHAVQLRYALTGATADRDVAAAAFSEAMRQPEADLAVRMDAARVYGDLWAASGGWASAAEGYVAAVRLLPMNAGLELGRPSREASLRASAWMAADCAASLVAARQPPEAVEALELGRAILWSQQLALQSDTAQLNDRAPVLADRLRALQALLSRPLTADLPGLVSTTFDAQ